MRLAEHHMRAIEEAWKRGGKHLAAAAVNKALQDNVTHPGLGSEICTIEELDRSIMCLIGLHVGIVVGEASNAYELIEGLKQLKLYEISGVGYSERVQYYLGRPETVSA